MIIEEINNFIAELEAIDKTAYERGLAVSAALSTGEIGFGSIEELFDFTLFIITASPIGHYNIAITITRQATRLINQFLEDNGPIDLNNHETLADRTKTFKLMKTLVLVSEINVHLADKLLDAGLPGLAFDHMAIAEDPPYDKSDGSTHIDIERAKRNDQFWHFLIAAGDQYAREAFMRRETVHLKVRAIIGDVNGEGLAAYSTTKPFLIKGPGAPDEDIAYLCHLLKLLKAHYPHKTMLLQELFRDLNRQLDLEKKRRTTRAFEIAFTLAEVTNQLSYVKAALHLRSNDPVKTLLLKARRLLLERSYNDSILHGIVAEFLQLLISRSSDALIFDLQRQAYSEFINLAVVHCVDCGRYEKAVQLAYQWRTAGEGAPIGTEPPEDEALLLILPNTAEDKVSYVLLDNNDAEHVQTSGNYPLSQLIAIRNKIEGTWNVLLGNEESAQFNEDEHGMIDPEQSQAYMSALLEYFEPERITPLLKRIAPAKKLRVLELTWTNFPIIPLLSEAAERPMSALVNASADASTPPIRKALIWCDPDESLSFSVNEREIITSIMDRHGIQYDLFEGIDGCNKDIFIERYSDPSYDLIWLMCHGKFDSDDPTKSELLIQHGNPLRLEEIAGITPQGRPAKRLLVLNACQSSAAIVRYNSMGFIGLGTSLTKDWQTVTGHLWLTDFQAAPVLGCLFMNRIAGGKEWSAALHESRMIMRQGNPTIIEHMQAINPDVALIYESTRKDLSLSMYAYSGIIFE